MKNIILMDQPTALITANDVLGWIGFILSVLLVCLYAIDDNYRRFPCSIYLYSLLSAAIVSFAIPLGSAVNHVNLDTTNGTDITCQVQGKLIIPDLVKNLNTSDRCDI